MQVAIHSYLYNTICSNYFLSVPKNPLEVRLQDVDLSSLGTLRYTDCF